MYSGYPFENQLHLVLESLNPKDTYMTITPSTHYILLRHSNCFLISSVALSTPNDVTHRTLTKRPPSLTRPSTTMSDPKQTAKGFVIASEWVRRWPSWAVFDTGLKGEPSFLLNSRLQWQQFHWHRIYKVTILAIPDGEDVTVTCYFFNQTTKSFV